MLSSPIHSLVFHIAMPAPDASLWAIKAYKDIVFDLVVQLPWVTTDHDKIQLLRNCMNSEASFIFHHCIMTYRQILSYSLGTSFEHLLESSWGLLYLSLHKNHLNPVQSSCVS